MFEQQRSEATQWWYNLAERERLLVSTVVVFLVLIITFFIVKKTFDYKAEHLQGYKKAQIDYRWMSGKKSFFDTANNASDSEEVRNLFKTVSSSLKEFKLDVKRVNPESDNTIRLDFDNAKFDHFWQWLVNLQQREGVYIKSINIDRQSTEGLVDVRVSVTRGV